MTISDVQEGLTMGLCKSSGGELNLFKSYKLEFFISSPPLTMETKEEKLWVGAQIHATATGVVRKYMHSPPSADGSRGTYAHFTLAILD